MITSKLRMAAALICATVLALTAGGMTAKAAADPPATPFSLATYPRVDGSTALQPLGVAFKALFTGQNVTSSDVVFNTTDPAYQNLIDGKTDLILVSYPSQDELDRAAAAGVEFEIMPVTTDGFVFLTNADNPVTSLTVAQLRDIYSGKITNWKDVGGPDLPIIAYQRPDNSGSQTGMYDLVMQGTPMMSAPQLQIGTMFGLINSVSASFDGGSGALGYSYYYFVTQMYGDLAANPQLSKIKLMAIDGVTPTAETIRSGDYPLHTSGYIVFNKAEAPDSPTRQLAAAMLSHEGQQAAMEAGYIPVDPTIQLPPPPASDPNALTSLDETYAVNPLTFTTSIQYLKPSQPIYGSSCIQVTRLTVSGLADATVQNSINARFAALEDSLGKFSYFVSDTGPMPTPCDAVIWYDEMGFPIAPYTVGATPDYASFGPPGRTPGATDQVATMDAVVGANFANVLSLRAALHSPPGYLAGGTNSSSLNVRLDTGADLTAADIFTTNANVGGMIQLEAQASDSYCTETCANDKANTYRSNPQQPFSFSSGSATIMSVKIPFASYWPQVAIFKKYAAATGLYTSASPASCPVVTTYWDATLGVCRPFSTDAVSIGSTLHVPATVTSASVALSVAASDTWTVIGNSQCANLATGYYNDVSKVSPTSGSGPGTVTYAIGANTGYNPRIVTLCAIVADSSHVGSYGEITIQQDAAPPTLNVTVDPGDGATVTNSKPTFTGVLTDADGVPVGSDVGWVNIIDKAGGTMCAVAVGSAGTWSCTPTSAMTNGTYHLYVLAAPSNSATEYARTDFTITVANPDAPAIPQITSPTAGQRVYAAPSGLVMVSGTATPGSDVSVYTPGGLAYGCSATASADGSWHCFIMLQQPSTATVPVSASATMNGAPSGSSPTTTFQIDTSAKFQVAVTHDEAKADGTETDTVTVTMVKPDGTKYAYPIAFTATATSDDNDIQVPTTGSTAVSGVATLQIASTTSGPHDVQIWVDGQPAPIPSDWPNTVMTPTTLTFTEPPTPPAKPTLALSKNTLSNRSGGCVSFHDSLTATATLLDAQQKPMGNQPIVFTVDAPLYILTSAGEKVLTYTVNTDADGIAQVTIQTDAPGPSLPTVVLNARASYLGQQSDPARIIIAPVLDEMPPDYVLSLLTVTPTDGGTSVLADGKSSYTATVQASLGCGVAANVSITFGVTGSASMSDTMPVKTDKDGLATITITDKAAEEITVTAGLTDNVSPATTYGSPKIVTFAPVPVTGVLTLSTDKMSNSPMGNCGSPPFWSDTLIAAVTVTTPDGEPVAGQTVHFAVDAPLAIIGPSDARVTEIDAQTDDTGVASVHVTSTTTAPSGTIRTVVASINGSNVEGAPAGVTITSDPPLATDPPYVSSRLTITPTAGGTTVLADGQASYTATVEVYTVAVCDSMPSVGDTVTFTVTGGASMSKSMPVTTDQNGMASITITDETEETVTVTVTVTPGDPNNHLPYHATMNSPKTIEFTAPDVTARLSLSADHIQNSIGVCGEPFTSDMLIATVAVIDTGMIASGPWTVHFAVEAPLVIVGPSGVYANALDVATNTTTGMAWVMITSNAAKTDVNAKKVTATIDDVIVKNSPSPVTIATATPVPASPTIQSTLTVSPSAGGTTVLADGQASYTATVFAYDVCDVPSAGETVTFKVTGGASMSKTMPVTTGPDGKATITITDKTAEKVTVTATVKPSNPNDLTPYIATVGSPKDIVFTAPPTPRSPGIALSVISLPEGASLNITGTGWAPSEKVHLTVQSNPVDLGFVTADANGVLPATIFMVPVGFGAGSHTVTAVGPTSGTRTAAFTVTVTPAPPPPPAPAAAPGPRVDTGGFVSSPPAGLMPAVVAMLLGLVVLGLLTIRRRVAA